MGKDPMDVFNDRQGKKPIVGDISAASTLWSDLSSHMKTNKTGSIKELNLKYLNTNSTTHVYAFIHKVPKESQQRVFDNSIGSLLPCKR